ncbi:MAG TPA: sigma-70 family RNA polymerase sigma factor [Gemmatimonadales bacterium]|nr:sigma-70 family RNA polymerase sigma factor [Gemmatimonadales bacterium]
MSDPSAANKTVEQRSRVDERQLVQRVRAGDAAAERALYDAHVDRVYRLAYRMAGDGDLAQDFTQETFIRAFGKIANFRGESSFGTWLHAIASSVILNGLRRVSRFRRRETDLEAAAQMGQTPVRAEPDLTDRLRQALDGLPDKYRMVVVMHDIEGYTHEEIGAALRIPPGTSKAQLSRARARLRTELAQFAPEWAT